MGCCRRRIFLALIEVCLGLVAISFSACSQPVQPVPPVQQDPPVPVVQPAPVTQSVTPVAPSSPVRTEGGSITKQTTEVAAAIPPLAQPPVSQPLSAVEVDMTGSAFSPGTCTIAVGGRVTWVNKDLVGHTVTSQIDLFDSGNMAKGESFSYIFSQPGTYEIFCDYHPLMKGTVIVKP
jgi:plastocyanin